MSTTQNAVLTVVYGNFTAPAGSVVDHVTIVATAVDPTHNPPSQSVSPTTTTVTFSNLTPDTYTFSLQAFPSSGPGFGSAVSTTLVVTGTTVTLQIPSSVTATQP